MYVEGRSSFGNNVEVSVLNETGGREVPIYNGLSASLAYLIALYRHRPALILRLQAMIADFADLQTGNYGFIGNHVRIINTRTVRNTVIADYATVENCTRIKGSSLRTALDLYGMAINKFLGNSLIKRLEGTDEEYYGVNLSSISAAQVIDLVRRWQDSVIGLDNLLYKDAKIEFSLTFMTGFGVDGSDKEKLEDFEGVRGAFESNPFVTAVKEHIVVKRALGEELIGRISPLL